MLAHHLQLETHFAFPSKSRSTMRYNSRSLESQFDFFMPWQQFLRDNSPIQTSFFEPPAGEKNSRLPRIRTFFRVSPQFVFPSNSSSLCWRASSNPSSSCQRTTSCTRRQFAFPSKSNSSSLCWRASSSTKYPSRSSVIPIRVSLKFAFPSNSRFAPTGVLHASGPAPVGDTLRVSSNSRSHYSNCCQRTSSRSRLFITLAHCISLKFELSFFEFRSSGSRHKSQFQFEFLGT